MSIPEETTLFSTRVPTRRLRKAERILRDLGLKPSDAFNILLAQIELRNGLPFEIVKHPSSGMVSAEEQAAVWTNALGPY